MQAVFTGHRKDVTRMSVYMAQARIKADRVADLRPAAEKLFAAIDAARPDGIRYAWFVLPDGETFVALVQVDDGVENPIPALPEYRGLQAQMEAWLAGEPSSHELSTIGSYRMF
jgi:hypothetical protein